MSLRDNPNAIIFGCQGKALEDEEKAFFARSNPLGFILFARNVDTPDQVRALVASLRECVGRDAPILIDQEGGRVRRLRPPYWVDRPAMAEFGRLAQKDVLLAEKAVRLNSRLIAADLIALGIDVDCAPLIDVPVEGAHDIIGDRAFAKDPDMAARLGRASLEGFLDGGVIGVVKHIPGHGRAMADSHLELPSVDVDRDVLSAWDFAPFRALADAPWAMTAHVVYKAIDPDFPATLSKKVIHDVIRGDIGCQSLLLSDDLSMKALSGDFESRARQSLAAGCDVVLHCNGDMAEMEEAIRGVVPMRDDSNARFERAARQKREAKLPDQAEQMLSRWLQS